MANNLLPAMSFSAVSPRTTGLEMPSPSASRLLQGPMGNGGGGGPLAASFESHSPDDAKKEQYRKFIEYLERRLFATVAIDGDDGGVLYAPVAEYLNEARENREKYYGAQPRIDAINLPRTWVRSNPIPFRKGLVSLEFLKDVYPESLFDIASFHRAVRSLHLTVENVDSIACATQRLSILEQLSKTTFLINNDRETEASYHRMGGVLAPNVVRVDNSISLNHCAVAQDLIEFFSELYEKSHNEIVARLPPGPSNPSGEHVSVTVRELCTEDPIHFTAERLGWDSAAGAVDGVGGASSFGSAAPPQREHNAMAGVTYDALNAQTARGLHQIGAVLRASATLTDGRLFQKFFNRFLSNTEQRRGSVTTTSGATSGGEIPLAPSVGEGGAWPLPKFYEMRVPITGLVDGEIARLAPSLKHLGRSRGVMYFLSIDRRAATQQWTQMSAAGGAAVPTPTVQDVMIHIFRPLFLATLMPQESDNPVSQFMASLGGIHVDSTISQRDTSRAATSASAAAVAGEEAAGDDADRDRSIIMRGGDAASEPFQGISEADFEFFLWCNLRYLNALRRRKGYHELQYRRGIGSGQLHSMLAGYLLADVVTNAASLSRFPVLQYLSMLSEVGVTVSPTADNARDMFSLGRSPLKTYLHCGMKVALATEEPMLYHTESDALLEEYASAQKLLRMDALDVTEIARNSVLISSFPYADKESWLGPRFLTDFKKKVHDERAHVSVDRVVFRRTLLSNEKKVLALLVARKRATGGHKEGLDADGGRQRCRWNPLMPVRDFENGAVTHDSRISFPRVLVPYVDATRNQATRTAATRIGKALRLRRKYIWDKPKPWLRDQSQAAQAEDAFRRHAGGFDEDQWTYEEMDGVLIAYKKNEVRGWPREIPTLEEFHRDLTEIKTICDSVDVKDYSYARLEFLEHKFSLHLALNHANEAGSSDGRGAPTRDFYHCAKVDTHVHMAAGMTARLMRDFIVTKLQHNSDDIVSVAAGQVQTLGMLTKKYSITENITVDQLACQADHTLFERFDNFNSKYNIMNQAELRTVLLKTDNFMNGRYFAELTNQTFAQFSRDRYTFAENRLSVYGNSKDEWAKLADWFDTHGMASKHNRWMIQMPRLYSMFRKNRIIGNFGQILVNIFKPLWEASIHPGRHPRLHNFLTHVSGFDSVDDESTLDSPFVVIPPSQWTAPENPPYNYYMYHLWANIRTLNAFRSRRGLSHFDFRPHSGESGSDEHLVGCFLVADAINHGINLRNDPALQYLYYLAQIGLAVSPLSNNALFMYYLNNPFADFFRRGLNVSLSTDDPLMFHQTTEPLIEEYSIAAKVWGFSPNDMCEIARNSALQSGFGDKWKREKLGARYFLHSSLGNDPNRTHLSDIRVAFRYETYHAEVEHLEAAGMDSLPVPRAMFTQEQENEVIEQEAVLQEVVQFSTQDQEMEVIQRAVEAMKAQRVSTVQALEAQRQQNKTLIENVTEVGARLKQLAEEAARLDDRPAPMLVYSKGVTSSDHLTVADLSKHRRSRAISISVTASPIARRPIPNVPDLDEDEDDGLALPIAPRRPTVDPVIAAVSATRLRPTRLAVPPTFNAFNGTSDSSTTSPRLTSGEQQRGARLLSFGGDLLSVGSDASLFNEHDRRLSSTARNGGGAGHQPSQSTSSAASVQNAVSAHLKRLGLEQ